MSEIAAREKFERARKSIMVAEDRLSAINKKLPELNKDVEELIVLNETQGYKGRTIERAQAEIDSLQKEKDTLEKTIGALQKALPELERAMRIETAETETITDYRDSLIELSSVISALPTLDELKDALNKIQKYSESLNEKQKRFFAVSKDLNIILVTEKLEAVGDMSVEGLIDDLKSLNYQGLLTLSDDLIDVTKEINQLQYDLFKVGTASLIIERPPEPQPETDYSPDGRFRRSYRDGCWFLHEKEKNSFLDDPWFPVQQSLTKPEFPEGSLLHRPPKKVEEDPKNKADIPGKMVYEDEEKVKDPDGATVGL